MLGCVTLILAAAWPLSSLLAELEADHPLNLFQMIARASLVVHVRVYDGSLRFALVDVLEPLKGEPPASRLRIAFRDFNFDRKPGTEPIVFPKDQEEILFLVPYTEVRQKEKNKDIFTLFLGARGRITVPAEGSGTIFDAIRRLTRISAQDPATQIETFTAEIAGDNPYLIEASLEEIARLHAATPALYGRLVRLLESRSPGVRVRALRIISLIFAFSRQEPGDGEAADQARASLQAVVERARNDGDQEVRVAAVQAIAAWPARSDVEPELRAIAQNDLAQEVRYEAQKALLKGARL